MDATEAARLIPQLEESISAKEKEVSQALLFPCRLPGVMAEATLQLKEKDAAIGSQQKRIKTLEDQVKTLQVDFLSFGRAEARESDGDGHCLRISERGGKLL